MRNRLIISGLATSGALETGFLTYLKYFPEGGTINDLCLDGSSCNNVLSSPYSVIPYLNIPLSSVAFVGYSVVALSALIPVLKNLNSNDQSQNALKSNSDSFLLFSTTSMASFSLYLMMILAFVLQQKCSFCLLSAFISISMAIITWNTNIVNDKTKAFVIKSSSILITSISSLFLFYTTSTLIYFSNLKSVDAITDTTITTKATTANNNNGIELKKDSIKYPPSITKPSTEQSINLSKRMKSLDAKMYGAYWCSHCYNQKQEFGIEAYKNLEYLECDKDGFNSKYDICKVKKVRYTYYI